MLRFTLRRLALVIPTFFGITLIAFGLVRLVPGDPIQVMAGQHNLTPAEHSRLMHEYGFDQPEWKQYLHFLDRLSHGDLGKSLTTREPVVSAFLTRFPATFELSFFAMLFALVVGLPAGVLAAVKRGSIFDHGVMGISLTGYSMPIFWWGLLLIVFFSGFLGWTPVSGRIDVAYYIKPITGLMLVDTLLEGNIPAFWSALDHLILPAIVLGTIPLAVIARQTRSAMLEVLGEDYVRTARAKGLSPMRVICVHALRNALIPVVTVTGLQVGLLFSGAILTETIFSWPGVGKWLVDAVYQRDYPTVQGGVLIIASLIMLVNLAVDLIYGLINPRIRYKR
ncbi:ABC transporter permease subunit [Salinisphaera sp. RV14]|uniref:ABC transporter permease subunit n=1 Tax=unclassified Salinisphaera TaxID=2649847 RepID=UPI003F86CB2E